MPDRNYELSYSQMKQYQKGCKHHGTNHPDIEELCQELPGKHRKASIDRKTFNKMSGSQLKKLCLFPLPEMMIIKQTKEQEQN